MEDIEKTVRNVVAAQLNISPEDIAPDDDFIIYLGADSLDMVEISMGLEDNLGIVIPDEGTGKLRTLRKTVEYIKTLKA